MSPNKTALRERLRVLRAQTGDREALDELLRSVQSALFGYIRGLVGDPGLAEDVLQDVFLSICKNLRHLREPELFRPWAYRIASRRALRLAQGKRKRGERSLEESGIEPAEDAPQDEALDRANLIAQLPSWMASVSPASRAVLSLHYLEEMSLREAADVLGIPVGTAKSRLNYGLASLRGLIRQAKTRHASHKEVTNE